MENSEQDSADAMAEGRKLFVGGLSWDTTHDGLKNYFEKFGTVVDAVIMRDKITGRSRGFGFITYSDEETATSVSQQTHTLDSRTIEAKPAVSRDEIQKGGSGFKTKKIFVGGLPVDVSEEGFKQYFEKFGTVTDAIIMLDKETGRPRGFGFVTFEEEGTVETVCQPSQTHEINGKVVDVKKAEPKRPVPGMAFGPGYGQYGGGYDGMGFGGFGRGGSYAQPFSGRGYGRRGYSPGGMGQDYPRPSGGYGRGGYSGYGNGNGGYGYGGGPAAPPGAAQYGGAYGGTYGSGYPNYAANTSGGTAGYPEGAYSSSYGGYSQPAGYGGGPGYAASSSYGAEYTSTPNSGGYSRPVRESRGYHPYRP